MSIRSLALTSLIAVSCSIVAAISFKSSVSKSPSLLKHYVAIARSVVANVAAVCLLALAATMNVVGTNAGMLMSRENVVRSGLVGMALITLGVLFRAFTEKVKFRRKLIAYEEKVRLLNEQLEKKAEVATYVSALLQEMKKKQCEIRTKTLEIRELEKEFVRLSADLRSTEQQLEAAKIALQNESKQLHAANQLLTEQMKVTEFYQTQGAQLQAELTAVKEKAATSVTPN